MKKYKIIWLVLIVLVIGVGSLHMLKQSNLFSDGKANLQSIKEKQLDYLKSQEEEIKKFVKSQNPKIESVQVDWKQTNWEEVGNGTPWGGGEVIRIFGGFNHIEYSSWSVLVDVEDGKVDIDSIMQGGPLRTGGDIFE